jgi:hypothetical protein
LPTSSFDTFFACTILVAAALIGTAFLTSTLQTRITSTQDIDKNSYLKAVADRIITNPGTPTDWGKNGAKPTDFGLASSPSTSSYELDLDKVSMLNSVNSYSLSCADIEIASKLNNIALGLEISQIMTINILQQSNLTLGGSTLFTFTVSADIDSNPTSADLHCYVAADNYLNQTNHAIPNTGISQVTIQIPSSETNNALLIVFARASIDDRITSYAIYNFGTSKQELIPSNTNLALNALDYTLNLNNTSPGLTFQNSYVFSYSYHQPLPILEGSKTPIPKIIDQSPLVLVVFGLNGTVNFQDWTSYPQVPLTVGANFEDSEKNVFSYMVTIGGVLYRLDLSFGDLPP